MSSFRLRSWRTAGERRSREPPPDAGTEHLTSSPIVSFGVFWHRTAARIWPPPRLSGCAPFPGNSPPRTCFPPFFLPGSGPIRSGFCERRSKFRPRGGAKQGHAAVFYRHPAIGKATLFQSDASPPPKVHPLGKGRTDAERGWPEFTPPFIYASARQIVVLRMVDRASSTSGSSPRRTSAICSSL